MNSASVSVNPKGDMVKFARDVLKSTLPEHPILQRLSLKLSNKFDKNTLLARYTRMPHRHSRS